MSLVEELIATLSSENCNLEAALAKAQVLAHHLNAHEMRRWVLNELRGYENAAELPDYRIVTCSLIGHVSNGFYRANRANLPTSHLDERIREMLTKKKVLQSIPTIQGWARSEDALSSRVSPELYGELSKGFADDYYVESAWGEVSPGVFTQIVAQVRSRLLDFVLQLSTEIPQLNESSPSGAQRDEASDLFRNAVFGNNATIIIGNGNSQTVSNSIVANDFDSLAAHLESLGMRYGEINDLREAIEKDKTESSQSVSLGSRVKDWIARMTAKAAKAAWNISTETAAGVLTAALLAYYGIAA